MKASNHATTRCQQRGVPPLVVDLLLRQLRVAEDRRDARMRDQAADLLQPFGVAAADTLQFQAFGFGLLNAYGARRGVIAQRAAKRDRAIDATSPQ